MARLKLLRNDIPTSHFGPEICRHCISMLRLAMEGHGEYVVARCGRCGLAVDSRKISTYERTLVLNHRAIQDARYKGTHK